ncbi:MAG: transglycosylase domain-containing protein, partial [Spirochaetaceae bacterium]|nr:transglycosylase domain-containing protein [Spirochaetaceae bacterium]
MSQKFLAVLRERWLSFRNKGWRSGLVLVAVTAVLLALGCCLLSLLPWPELDSFLGRPYSTRLYDRNGQLLHVSPLEAGLRREWYDLDQLPPRVVEVFLAAEDQRFYQHRGVDFVAVVRAAVQNLQEGRRVSGASTITMQLVRLVEPRGGGGVSLWTKLLEA